MLPLKGAMAAPKGAAVARLLRAPARGLAGPQPEAQPYDVAVVGAGIVGLAAARALQARRPGLRVAVLEKEAGVARHQTGHNSGVIHSGLYYEPGSLKARLCVRGAGLLYAYCERRGLAHRRCGKLVVAARPGELARLRALHQRGLQNGVPGLRLLQPPAIRQLEPHCRGLLALHCPSTGSVDYARVAAALADDVRAAGGVLLTGFEVCAMRLAAELPGAPVLLSGAGGARVRAAFVLGCAGLQADRVAQLSGGSPEPAIVPFRGDYLLLRPERSHLVRGHVYPVPDPGLPFLGAHLTPRLDGSVWLGPSAVLAFKREGYGPRDFSARDTWEALRHGGLPRLALRHAAAGLAQLYGALAPAATVRRLRRLVPELRAADVARGPSGVRAQALDARGRLVDDFVFEGGAGPLGARVLHVRNAPSPAATAALAIAEVIAEQAGARFGL